MKLLLSKATPAAMLLLLATAQAWEFIVYPDSQCETTPSAEYKADVNQDCKANPTSHRSFELHNMGNCFIYMYANEADCDDGLEFQQIYDATNQDTCIPPNYTWDWFRVDSC